MFEHVTHLQIVNAIVPVKYAYQERREGALTNIHVFINVKTETPIRVPEDLIEPHYQRAKFILENLPK